MQCRVLIKHCIKIAKQRTLNAVSCFDKSLYQNSKTKHSKCSVNAITTSFLSFLKARYVVEYYVQIVDCFFGLSGFVVLIS
jgi:hypothetical protein